MSPVSNTHLPSDPPNGVAPIAWPVPLRALFRFTFLYFVVSATYWVLTFADKSAALLTKAYSAVWRPVVHGVASHLFHWPARIEPNFLHDSQYLYALETSFLLVALLFAGLWSVLDRKQQRYDRLNHALRVFVRYVLAYLMLHYGMDKVFLLQFPAPSPARLVERFGDYSPNSLMWAFIGSSTVYTIFGGLAEITGALLLLFRKTTTLGALITFAVMFNVTVMNFSYDVTVKLLCLNILLMAIYLVLPDAGRLLNFFFLNRATQPALLAPPLVNQRMAGLAPWIKTALVLYIALAPTLRDWRMYRTQGAGAPLPPLYGLYEARDFAIGETIHPPMLSDPVRWRYVIFDAPNKITLQRMDESRKTYFMVYDSARHEITIDAQDDPLDKSVFSVNQPAPDQMTLQGKVAGAVVVAHLQKIDPRSFTLTSRGFHWISESSFVR